MTHGCLYCLRLWRLPGDQARCLHDLVVDQRKHQASAVETGATKHRAHADRAKIGKLILEEIEETGAHPRQVAWTSAGLIATDSPQPQADV